MSNDLLYHVVVDDEEQYSIWPAGHELPAGWRAVGFNGAWQDCITHIDEVWTDIRPASGQVRAST